MTNEELMFEFARELRNGGQHEVASNRAVELRAELLRRLGAADSASPQPDFKVAVIEILANCAYRYVHPESVHKLDPQSVIDKQIDNGVETLKKFFAAAPAQEPDRPGRTKLLMKFWSAMHLAGFAKENEWDAQEKIHIEDLVKLMTDSAAQEQPVENSPNCATHNRPVCEMCNWQSNSPQKGKP